MALESLTGWLLRCRPSQFMSALLYLATVGGADRDLAPRPPRIGGAGLTSVTSGVGHELPRRLH
jgi:hypothetical protein